MKRIFSLALVSAMSVFCGCDWIHHAFTNSIPFRGTDQADFHVYLGVDGLSHLSAMDAKAEGAFAEPEWHEAKFISMFPATSDASWTRILHTEPIGGYEIEYYHPPKDEVLNSGFAGLMKHVLPNFADSLNLESKYLTAFDYRANGYAHSVGAYHDTFVNLSESLDNLFITLEGRLHTATAFTGYVMEFDVMGHMQTRKDIREGLLDFAQRMTDFRRRYPQRKIHFTLFADHGLDFVQVKGDKLIKIDEELPKVGVTPVKSFSGRDPEKEVFAIPIQHTRVTYVAMHTPARLAEGVASRTSRLPSVDLTVARVNGTKGQVQWFGVWAEGERALTFGFDAASDLYIVSAKGNPNRVGLALEFTGAAPRVLSDEEAFALTKHGNYPDLLYRVRSALSTVGTIHPAEVIVSFREGYASMGFSLPGGANDTVMSGFHGALAAAGSVGTLLTTERMLPDVVRSETIFDLFPRAKEHLRSRGVDWHDGDASSSLRYSQ